MTLDVNNGSLKDLKKETEDLKKSIEDSNKAIEAAKKQMAQLGSELKLDSVEYKSLAKSIETHTKNITDNTAKLDNNKKVLDLSKGSLQQNKALLELLTKTYDELSKSQGDNSEQVQDLNVKIGHLNLAIASQEEALKKSREVFDFHAKSIEKVEDALSKLKDSGSEFGPEFADTLEYASKGFNAMKEGLAVVKTGFQSVGGAIKATGFGLLVLVLESVVEYFTETKDGAEKLRQLLAGVGVVVDIIKKGFASLGRSIVDAVLHPVESIKSLSEALRENITNRLAAIKDLLEGLSNWDFKKMGDAIIQGVTGVTHGTEKLASAYKSVTKAVKETSAEVIKAAKAQSDEALAKRAKEKKEAEEKKKREEKERREAEARRKAYLARLAAEAAKNKIEKAEAEKELGDSQARMAKNLLSAFAKEVKDTEDHFAALKTKYAKYAETIEQLKKEEAATIAAITKKFQDEDAKKLEEYHEQINQLASEYLNNAREKSLIAIDQETADKLTKLDEQEKAVRQKRNELESISLTLLAEGKLKESNEILKAMQAEEAFLIEAGYTKEAILKEQVRKKKEIRDAEYKEIQDSSLSKSQENIDKARGTGHESSALKQEIELLNVKYKIVKDAAEKEGKDTTLIKAKHDKDKAELEEKLSKSRIHAGDKLIDAVMKNTKKDSAAYKAAFLAKKATAIADTIMSTKQSIMESLKAYSGIPFIGQALGIAQAAFMAVQGATSIAEIAKQKPGMARGGQFISDGRGALLPGYSRTDNTNAYLRSGEAVVVSEAMRNPWARNLVSAINVAHGGRDFSVPNAGRGYAIGGIFTDGGNANRYYSAPVNDQKDLANTLAYQMLNNFPPIYVDVKDVNNQQNILAQTVNRVTL